MSRLLYRLILLAALASAGACTNPGPTPTANPTATAAASASVDASPSLSRIRNHMLSTLDYVAEIGDALAGASNGTSAYRALQPLAGVVDDERRWFAAEAARSSAEPVRRYGQQLDATAVAVHAAVDNGPSPGPGAVDAARSAVEALLALRPAIEALAT